MSDTHTDIRLLPSAESLNVSGYDTKKVTKAFARELRNLLDRSRTVLGISLYTCWEDRDEAGLPSQSFVITYE